MRIHWLAILVPGLAFAEAETYPMVSLPLMLGVHERTADAAFSWGIRPEVIASRFDHEAERGWGLGGYAQLERASGNTLLAGGATLVGYAGGARSRRRSGSTGGVTTAACKRGCSSASGHRSTVTCRAICRTASAWISSSVTRGLSSSPPRSIPRPWRRYSAESLSVRGPVEIERARRARPCYPYAVALVDLRRAAQEKAHVERYANHPW